MTAWHKQMLEKEKIGLALVAIPLIHVVVASLYLSGQCNGFGANLCAFVTPKDLFITSIQSLVPVYTGLLLIPLLLTMLRHTFMEHPYAADRVAATTDEELKRSRQRSLDRSKLLIVVIASSVALIGFGLFCYWLSLGIKPNYYIIYFTTAPLLMLVVARTLPTFGIYSIGSEICVAVVTLIYASFFFGLNSGQLARNMQFSEINQTNPHCGKNLAITTIGSLYIAIAPDNSLTLVDDKCAPTFAIPRSETRITGQRTPKPTR
jgi:hypothetical protein